MNRNFTLVLLLLIVLSCSKTQKNNDTSLNAIIYHGGDIITMEGSPGETAEAVVTINDSIAFVGNKNEAESNYPMAEKYDLKGSILLPGLIDNHLHPALGAVLMPLHWITPEDWQLADGRKVEATLGKEDFLMEVKKLVDAFKPEDQIVQIFGYSQFFHGEIYKKDLDEISTTVPINIFHRSFHENIFNSVGLDFYGYTRENMDDPQADFDKGLILEEFQQLDFLYQRWLPKLTLDSWKNGLEETTELMLQNGVTSVHGPGGFLGATPEQIDIMYEVFSKSPSRSYFSADVRPSYFESGYEGSMAYMEKTA